MNSCVSICPYKFEPKNNICIEKIGKECLAEEFPTLISIYLSSDASYLNFLFSENVELRSTSFDTIFNKTFLPYLGYNYGGIKINDNIITL